MSCPSSQPPSGNRWSSVKCELRPVVRSGQELLRQQRQCRGAGAGFVGTLREGKALVCSGVPSPQEGEVESGPG